MLNVLDLFSGIGGFSLGLERTGGFRTVAFCEIEQFCREILKKHWPGVPVYEDVATLDAARLAADGISVDVLCGGFPCQDISIAGRGAGLSGERSGLWWEFYRLIQEIRPQYALIENVSALRSRGLDEVLGALAAIGYDAEWHCIPASAVGAPHRRDRVWIVAYPQHEGWGAGGVCRHGEAPSALGVRQASPVVRPSADVADPGSIASRGGEISFAIDRQEWKSAQAGGEGLQSKHRQTRPNYAEQSSADVADTHGINSNQPHSALETRCALVETEQGGAAFGGVGGEPRTDVADAHIVVGNARWSGDAEQSAGRRDAGGSDCGADGMADADCAGLERQWRIAGRVGAQFTDVGSGGWWATEPDVGRVAHGIPDRVDRLRALGNAVVPQIPEILGRAILAQCPG